MKKVFIDSDLFVRDLRYPRDPNSEINARFLKEVYEKKIRGVTSIFNVLEACGVVSFNLSAENLEKLYAGFTSRYNIRVFVPANPSGILEYDPYIIFQQIQKKQGLGDAQVSYVVERFASQLSCFVSWNAPHFADKLSIPVKTPEEF